jgi:hypothetical protein
MPDNVRFGARPERARASLLATLYEPLRLTREDETILFDAKEFART